MKKSAQTILRPDAFYTIAAANGRVLEVADFNTENGASVRLWSYEGQPWQQWQFVEAGEDEYRIKNRFTGKVMDLAMSGVNNGTWVHQWSQTSGAGQRWQVVEAGGGRVKLRNVLADKVMDLVDMRGAWKTAPRPRSGRMYRARTSCGSWTPCPSACWKRTSPRRPPRRPKPRPRARGQPRAPAPRPPKRAAANRPGAPAKTNDPAAGGPGGRPLFARRAGTIGACGAAQRLL